MASLEEAFTTQINTGASARNPNAYLGMSQQQQQGWNQPQQGWDQPQQGWGQPQQGWGQPQQGWLTPKQPTQIVNDSVSPQQAAAQIAHQHRFTANELRLASDDSADTHWWFIRPRTGVEYCYPKRFGYRADE
jgi:hypothetical protein